MKKTITIALLCACALSCASLDASQESAQERSQRVASKLGAWRQIQKYHEPAGKHGPSMINSLSLSADKKMLACLSDSTHVNVWQANSHGVWSPKPLMGCESPDTGNVRGQAMALARDKSLLVIGAARNVLVFDLADREGKSRLPLRANLDQAGAAPLMSVALSKGQRMIASGHRDGSVRLWAANEHGVWTLTPHATFNGSCSGMLMPLAVSEDNNLIAYGDATAIKVGESNGNITYTKDLGRITNRGFDAASSVGISSDKLTVVYGTMSQAVIVLERENESKVWSEAAVTIVQEPNDVSYGGSILMPVALSTDAHMLVHGTPVYTSRMESINLHTGERTPAQGNFNTKRQLVGIKTLDNNGAWRQEPQNALPEGIDQVTAIA
ncbi:MAG: WD40 repeat domain-containing protein, partial [Candidatus Babeliales bacterium]|nr:WD40 repeat domain-containing protein [Candidatus Babeliales bacterium]